MIQTITDRVILIYLDSSFPCDFYHFNCSGHPFPGDLSLGLSRQGCEVPGSGPKLVLQSSSKYIQEIRQRLEENAAAREQREKRRDRFLVEQLKAHEAQEVKLLLSPH